MELVLIFSNLRYRQYFYAVCALLTVTAGSIHETWSSPYIPQLKSQNSPIGITLETLQSSLVVSLMLFGSFLGSIFSLWGIDYFGRKKTLIIAALTNFGSWILIYFAKSAEQLYIARIVGGIGFMLALNDSIIYIGEISDNDNRGKLGFLLAVFKITGSVFGLLIGPLTSYKNFAILSALLAILGCFCNLFIPESPYYLIKSNKFEEAKNIIQKLSPDSFDCDLIEKRLQEIIISVENDMKNTATLKELICKKIYRKPLIIHISLKVIMYFSGTITIKSYMQTIIEHSGSNLSPSTASIIFGVCSLTIALLSAEIVDKIGRKPLLIASCFVCCLINFILASYFYFEEATSLSTASISWLPFFCLIIFEIFAASGIIPLPLTVAGEIYPLNIKGIAVSLVSVATTPLAMILQWTFEPMNVILGSYCTFWLYSCFCFLGLLFGVFVFLETKGKSFEEIQDIFNTNETLKLIDKNHRHTTYRSISEQ